MVKIDKNNLESDLSPYLKQHKNNPVNWQIWNLETLKEAKNKTLRILLISKLTERKAPISTTFFKVHFNYLIKLVVVGP